MKNQGFNDYDIQALVDNELTQAQEQDVRAYLERDRHARDRFEQLMRQKKLLQLSCAIRDVTQVH